MEIRALAKADLARAPLSRRRWFRRARTRFALSSGLERPRMGNPVRAAQLASGLCILPEAFAEWPAGSAPWGADLGAAAGFLHGHAWLADAAEAERVQRDLLAGWAHDWIARHGQPADSAWAPDLAAERLRNWLAHAALLLRGVDQRRSDAFFRCLRRHQEAVRRDLQLLRPGLPRIRALTAQLHAELGLEPGDGMPERTLGLLGDEAAALSARINAQQLREPLVLLAVAEELDWAVGLAQEAGVSPDKRLRCWLSDHVPMIAQLLRGDGGLPGGLAGAAAPGLYTPLATPALRLGALLYGRGARPDRAPGYAEQLGFAHLRSGASSVTVDIPPVAPAQPSALDIEFSAGAQRILLPLACEDSGLTTPISVEGAEARPARATSRPHRRQQHMSPSRDGVWFLGESETWLAPLGLIHERRLHLAENGALLTGEDTLIAHKPGRSAASKGRAFTAAFLISPEFRVKSALGGAAALLEAVTEGGERWLLRSDAGHLGLGRTQIRLAESPLPRLAHLIRLRGTVDGGWGRISWSLRRLTPGR